MKTKSSNPRDTAQPPAAGEAAHTFPKLYRCRDAANGEHCLCVDDSRGNRVLNVTLSGHLNTEPSQAAWAAEVERRFNSHAALVEALELFLSYDMQQGTYDSLRLNPAGQDGMTPEQMIYLDAVDAARSALAAAKL